MEIILRIVLVEDSEVIRAHLITLLIKLPGVQIAGQATSEEDAILLIAKEQPDVVILDLSLSPGSGLNVLQALRAAGNRCLVYVLSSQTIAQYRQRASALGADDFFDKSGGIKNMLAAIRERLASS